MKVIKSLRAPVLVTLVLLLICGLIYPVVMTLMSQALFPSQANGSIIYVDGQAVGAKNVGQDFTDPRFMRCRPSAYQYNTYTVDEEGNKFYNDGSEYAGVASGSNNYGASNPALAERVQGDIDDSSNASSSRNTAMASPGRDPMCCSTNDWSSSGWFSI